MSSCCQFERESFSLLTLEWKSTRNKTESVSFNVSVAVRGLKSRDENPMMTFPINTELFVDKRAALYMQKDAKKNKGKRKEGKIVGTKEQQEVGIRNHNGSLFGNDFK